jgi:predicted HTH transcriptional regulator
MEASEALELISSGETSKVQFKKIIDNDDSIVAEMIAFSNSKGGIILFGVEDNGTISGLSSQQLHDYNNRISTIANEKITPQIFLFTEVVSIPAENGEKKILAVQISEGTSKPYKDINGTIWIKQGSNKRKLTDNNELIRLFQQSGMMDINEMIIPQTSIDDINFSNVEKYIKIIQKKEAEEEIKITEVLLTNLNILKNGHLTLAGLLVFAKNPQLYRPTFCIKAISFFGNSIGGSSYRDNIEITGTIPYLFEEGMRFFKTNLLHRQQGQNFNALGILEISEIALEELLQNALIHRDYSKNAPIRLMVFDNRVEIVSPGSLPNSLTVENIKLGNAAVRNNLLASYCSKLMNYRGFGSGIIRALNNQPNIEFINDESGEQFTVKIPRESNS